MFKEPLVKKGRIKDFSIERFEINEEEARRYITIEAIHNRVTRLKAGTYFRLMERGMVWMSNTPDEYSDHKEFIKQARGRVLIVGLGLGLVLREVLDKGGVESVTCVEKELPVIRLVGGAFIANKIYGPKLNLVCADLWEWWPTPEVYGKFDSAWVDIWPNYHEEMLAEFRTARNHLAAVCAPTKTMCWKEKELKSGRNR